MLKQIDFFMECKGKTIVERALSYNSEYLVIAFSDDTFSILQAASGSYDGDSSSFESLREFNPGEIYAEAAVEAGVLTLDELRAMREERRQERTVQTLEWQRQEYERLKAIFEKEDKS